MKYTLGLDMGVASLGWAVISEDDNFIDSGVRIFPAGVDNFNSAKEKHPNQDRRIARGMRRRLHRKVERKKAIGVALKELGWMPTNEDALHKWYGLDIYLLRHRALSEKITLSELGRIIYHLNQRRGFLSLRKTESEGDKEAQGMLGEISDLEKAIEETGARTLGNHLYSLYQKEGISTRLRNRHFSRKMLHNEFSEIWEEQIKHYPEILTEALRFGTQGPRVSGKDIKTVKPISRQKDQSLLEQFGLEGMTFFQRSVYWPADSIGKCELEGGNGEYRAPLADRRFQEFRLLQEVNNLRITDHSNPGSPLERRLDKEERDEAIKYLTGKDKPKLEALKKYLCKSKTLTNFPKEHAQVTFNLEAGGRTVISGTPTDCKLKTKKILGDSWAKLSEETKNKIVEALTLPAATDEDIREALEKISQLTEPEIDRLLSVSLGTGYGHLSVVALEKLLKPMREGKLYMHKDAEKSALAAAGYERRDQQARTVFDKLPLLDQLTNSNSEIFDPNQPVINNPVVLRSLTELRKVVNALIRKYGKPERIHVEMARSLKMGPKQRKEHQKETRGFEKERAEAVKELESYNIIPNRDAIQLLRLWREQKEQCPYSGRPISQAQLFGGGGEIDIDHIFPFSRSADNSMMNKVVCFRTSNATKGNKTPREWLEDSDPDAYEQLIQRTKSYRFKKRERFYAKEIPEGFVSRDLNDTAWMAKAARQYLSLIVPEAHHVQGTKGTHTSLLRDHWQLHSLLRNDGIDLKNRDDHRHHALDAILIGLCDQRRIKALLSKHKFELKAKVAKEEGRIIYRLKNSGSSIDPPWDGFRDSVETSLNKIWVSHRPKRKVSGALHKETNYGKTPDGDLVRRKPIQELSKKEVAGIRDENIAKIVNEYIEEHGGNPACLKEITDEEPLRMPSGTPIKKVRTAIPYAHLTIREGTPHETHVQSAATHHLAIFSLGNGKHHFEPVTLYEASRRLRAKEPIVQKTYEGMPSEAEFQFHLCKGESIIATIQDRDHLFLFNTMATTSGQIWFSHHTEGAQQHKDPQTGASLLRTCRPGNFEDKFPNARKVVILPDGQIRNC
ncbi:type II CRISPR RNA-guided endonuclease Cas9 [Akkermansiaceae bacterium]|nr:type II CRISPR RNA-guided endonuclease Cas9 [Akkermansiaceae bacterium]